MRARMPLIGVVCGHQQDPERYYVNAPYIYALERAQGVPVLIPHMPKEMLLEILPMFAGILLPGGIDIDPTRFGEQPHPRWT
jgi:putative glutamine amidotransferase